jgi:hypothetical protein
MGRFPDKAGHEVVDVSPCLKLLIDKEGKWFQNDTEIIHPHIYRQFCSMLEKTLDGGYQVRTGREVCRVQVEDAPFVVRQVVEEDEGRMSILLNDGTIEPLDPQRFWIGAENVPYCEVKRGAFHARFSRPAYYQLARHIIADERDNEFILLVGDKRTLIKRL